MSRQDACRMGDSRADAHLAAALVAGSGNRKPARQTRPKLLQIWRPNRRAGAKGPSGHDGNYFEVGWGTSTAESRTIHFCERANSAPRHAEGPAMAELSE